MQSSEDYDFKLLRLILLDSYSPAGEAIIDLADGAILTGENGAGKTSLLSLISIFYGENPGHCTSGSSTFAEFYLPHSTSYVIFEYVRHGIKCMAVLYVVGDGSFNYRFIRNAYDIKLFTKNGDGTTLIPSLDLKTELKAADIPHSPVLVLSEYRNTIQGRIIGAKNIAESRRLVAEYSFTASGSRLVHIDKIVSGMFTRKANFDEFLSVIVDYISDDGNTSISVSGRRDEFADWPAQFSAYNEVMRLAPVTDEIGDFDAKLKGNTRELCILHAKLLLLKQYQSKQHDQFLSDRVVVSSTLSQEQADYSTSMQKIESRIARAKASASESEDRVKTLDTQRAQYDKDAINTKAAQVAQLPDLRASIKTLNDRKEILLGEHTKIEQQYSKFMLDVGNEHLKKVDAFNLQMQDARDQAEPELAANSAALVAELSSIKEEEASKLALLRAERDAALGVAAQWSARAESPVPPPDLVAAFNKKREEFDTASDTLRAAQTSRQVMVDRKSAAFRSFTDKDAERGRAERRVAELADQHQRLLSHLNPDNDTLLHFLRSNKPDWSEDIAKIIREDVLSMKVLSPSVSTGNSLYGISLDLSHIEATLSANESALQDRIRDCLHEGDESRTILASIEDQLEILNKARADADTALSLHDATIATHTSRLDTLKRELDIAQRAVNESVARAKQDAMDNLNASKHSIQSCDQKIKDAQTAFNKKQQDCIDRHKVVEQSLKQKRDDALQELQARITAANAEKNRLLGQLDLEKKNALSSKGVNTTDLHAIDEEINQRSCAITDAESWSERVNTWRYWSENEFPKRANYVEEAAKYKEEQQQAESECAALSQRWGIRRDEIQFQLTTLSDKIATNERDQENILHKVQQLTDFPPSNGDMSAAPDTTWTSGVLFSHAIKLFESRKSLQTELWARVRKVRTVFTSVPGSPTDQYINTWRGNLPSDDNDPSAWVQPLLEWFSTAHLSRREILMMQAQTYGDMVTDFHSKLVKFQKEVTRFNTDIQKALNQTSVFRRISGISIHFDSALDKLKYWTDIETFCTAHQAWRRSSSELPPPEFADGLKRLVGHWEVREGIRAERRSLINIRGEVTENGTPKPFRTTSDLEKLSSNGLSYLILCTIFVAFVRKIRGDAKVQITWAVDELLDLDSRNIHDLLTMLRENGIRLVSACPEANVEILMQFEKLYRIQRSSGYPEIVNFTLDTEEAYV